MKNFWQWVNLLSIGAMLVLIGVKAFPYSLLVIAAAAWWLRRKR